MTLHCTSSIERVLATTEIKPTTACLIHKLGCTRKQAVSSTNSTIAGLFNNPNSVKADIAFMLFAATNSEESAKPYKKSILFIHVFFKNL